MEEKLRNLYNTLVLIETRGAATITMADCLRYLEQLIKDEQNKQPSLKSEGTTEV